MANEKLVIGESSVTASQMQDFFRQMKDGSITGGMVQNFLERKNPFEEILDNPAVSQKVLRDWERFYKKHFNLAVDLSRVIIPKMPKEEGMWRLLFIAEGLTNNKVFDACKRKFPCYKYTEDLDARVPKNDRDPKNGTYAIWVRNTVEADEIYKSKSANNLANENIKGITLLERDVYELKYFIETGEHLDINRWTFCLGSRDSDGHLPIVRWCGGEFEMSWHNAGHSDHVLRSREVIFS